MHNSVMISFGNFQNLIQLLDHFKDEATCKLYLEKARWGDNPCCPHCNHHKVYRTERGFKCANTLCHKKFSVTVGTIFENSKIKLRYWYAAIYLLSAHKKGISSWQLSRDLNICQKSAWFMLHRIRYMLQEKAPEKLINVVEADESFVGGKAKNRHAKKRKEKPMLGTEGKTVVLGFLQRNGKVRTMIVPDTKRETLAPAVYDNVETGTTVYTDEHSGYTPIDNDYRHEVVRHGKKEYVRGFIHTNTIEGFWSQLKRGIIGVYHQVSVKHLYRYCHEFCYRYNTRRMRDTDRFESALKNMEGRLRWDDLVRPKAAA